MSYSYRSSRVSSAPKRRGYGANTKPRGNRRKGQSEFIDPSRFVKIATGAQAEPYMAQHDFTDFRLAALLQQNLATKGYHTPSPIQDQAIPAGLAGRDVIGIASTGTGKTAAFALPILQRLVSEPTSAALIVAPTRELAQQIETECKALGKGTGLTGALLIGGTGMGTQLRDLRGTPRLVIGTPGRMKDHLERGSLRLESFNLVVLDEVDRMLDMGFVHDVTTILSRTATVRQSLFFSATLDARVRTLIDTFSHEPVIITLQTGSASDNVHQDVVRYQTNSDKLDKLHDLLITHEVSKVIIFDETQRGVERLHKELLSRGFQSESIHGGRSQGQRQRALTSFRENRVNVLVATDVAARGIDVADISHVINYSLPKVYDDYVHRIGRAGRAGKIGYALTFIQQ